MEKLTTKLSILLYVFLLSLVTLLSMADTGYSFQFNGVDDYLVAFDSESVDENLLQATIEAWIYLEEIPKPINLAEIPQKTWAIVFKLDSFELSLFTAAIDGITYISWHFTPAFIWPFTKFDVKPREWHHIAITYDGGNMCCWIDGMNSSSNGTGFGAISNANSKLYIGGAPTGERSYFHGEIKEVRISDIARYKNDFTPTERFKTDKQTRALWHLSSSTGFRDSAGNNNTLLYKGEPFSIRYLGKPVVTTWGQIKE
jgi:hypothetical protein